LGAIVAIHAENAAIHEHRERQFKTRGETTAAEWGFAKTTIVEAEAVHRAVFLAEKVGTPILIRHISTADALESVRQARQRGAPAMAETCPQYLVLDESILRRTDGFRYVCSPPVRSLRDQAAVWRAIQDGTINVIGSDHVSFSTEEKAGDGKDIFTSPSGFSGVETLFPLMFSEGFMKGRINLPHLAAITATNAAKLYGFFPKKGVILPGSDADIVVMDPNIRRHLRAEELHMDTDYIPYEGMEVQGYPVHTISRGRFVVRDGEFCGEKGMGQFVKCRLGGWRELDSRWRQE
jgi:dihydropyrimidinase